eukprot:1698849-Amphidinium_carterae.2
MKLEDINTFLKQSQRGEPKAAKRMENYYVEMDILQQVLRKKLEDNEGRIEDTEEFKTAIKDRDDTKLKDMVYKVMGQLQELRAQWREEKIEEDKRKKEEYRRAILQEEADRRREEEEERQRRHENENMTKQQQRLRAHQKRRRHYHFSLQHKV